MRNDFEKMCKELAKIKPCGCSMCDASNEYVCAYNAVKEYVREDENRLLKLKAEARSLDYGTFFSNLMSSVSFLIATLSLMITMYFEVFNAYNELKKDYATMTVVAIIGFAVAIYFIMRYYKDVSKWRKYIEVAIEELENPNNPDNPNYQNKKS